MADVEKYLDLITAFHRGKPKFSAVVETVSQCFVGAQVSYGQMVPAYDLDDAVGVQLDAVGEWAGISRNVRTPLEGVYFSFDVSGLGFEQGVWQGPFDPDTGVTSLDNETYRILIRAKIGANHWDGTLESSAAILNEIFQSPNGEVLSFTANQEQFATGDGSSRQYRLTYAGAPVRSVSDAKVYRTDWEGLQRLYPEQRTQLFRASNSFGITSGQWSQTRIGSSVAAVAPDGSANAFLITADGVGSSYVYQRPPISTGQPIELSTYVKAGTATQVSLYTFDAGSGEATFSLIGGGSVVQTSQRLFSARISDVGNGWYRISAMHQPVAPGNYAVAPAFVRTPGQSATFAFPLAQAQANKYLSPGDLSGAAWSAARLTSRVATPGPDGVTNSASTFTTDGTGDAYVYQQIAVEAGKAYDLIVYARAGTTQSVFFRDFQQNGLAEFTLSGSGSASSSGTIAQPAISSMGSGWYRCTATLNPTASGNTNIALCRLTGSSPQTATFCCPAIIERTEMPGAYIANSSISASSSLTDFSMTSTGLIDLGEPAPSGAPLTWSGRGTAYQSGTYVFIQDNGDMSIDIGISGERPSAVFLALLTGGYIPIKPEGVRVNYYIVPGVEGPLFGFDVGNQYISGLDVGVWGDLIQP